MKLFASCKEAAKATAESLEHELPLHRRVALNFHLLICSACRQYRRQVIGLNRLVRRYVSESRQSLVWDAATRERMVERLRRATPTPTGGTPATGGDGPAGGTMAPS